MTTDVIISVKGLEKHFHGGDLKALRGITTEIRRGEVVVVIGPSGSGKSTFLRCLNLLEEPTKGIGSLYDDELIFYGIDCAEHRNYRIMTITPDGYEMEQIRY